LSRESHLDTLLKVQRTLTAWVDAVAQPADETRLFQQACDLLVGSGFSRMAWFGYVSDSAPRVLEPVAASGDDDGFLEDLKLALHREHFEDPACISIRTGNVCWIEDLAAQPAFGPVQSAALRRGYTSVLSVPTMTNEKPCGALSLYFGERETHLPEIADLLRERLAHAMAAFARSAQRDTELRNLIDSCPQHLGLWDAHGTLFYLNRAAIDYHGYTVQDLNAGATAEILHPGDLDRVVDHWQSALASGKPIDMEARMRRFDGEYRWFLFRVNPLCDESGNVVKWCGTSIDIEDRKRAEEALRLREAGFQSVVESIPVPVAVTTAAGAVETVNRLTLEYFGKTLEELKGSTAYDVVHPDDLQHTVAAQLAAHQAGDAYNLASRHRRADGVYRWFNVCGFPVRDPQGRILRWFRLLIDIDDRKRAEEALRASESNLQQIVDSIPGLVCTMSPAGEFEQFNRQLLEYFGKTPMEMEDWATGDAVHPDDLPSVLPAFTNSIKTGTPFEIESRCRRADGVYRWFQVRALPVRDEDGQITGWYALLTDIDGRKRAEAALRESERNLNQIINALPVAAWSTHPDGYCDFLSERWLSYAGLSAEQAEGWGWTAAIHPDDVKGLAEYWQAALASGMQTDSEARMRRFDGEYRWFLIRANPLRDESGRIVKWYGTNIDIEDRKRSDEKLRQSQADLLEAQRLSHAGSWKHDLASGIVDITSEVIRIFDIQPDEDSSTVAFFFGRIHPEDRPREAANYERSQLAKAGFESDYRIVLPDGSIRHIHNVGYPTWNQAGDLLAFVGTVLDVTAAKEAEEKLRQSAREARLLLDLSPMHIMELGPNGERIYNNQAALDYFGWTLERWQTIDLREMLHPLDADRALTEVPAKFQSGSPFEHEVRLRGRDGQYRWFHFRFNPMPDEQGRIARWYAAGTDIDDRKVAEQQLRNENVSLREEIDRSSMFEEIVGTSAALEKVLSRLCKVAPTSSSVLITGETGTGKELVARAIHRHSRRSSESFITVNCAVIPRDLIASELFGHEKGAFTGATQLRLGRFELAAGGTIFLDEIGELPAETQIALLRVLQEQEFERVGGAATIRSDVRVIAATNRDLEAAISAGTFRSDLFYRLNVFPIEMPPLRERKEDIPLLVEYFLDRYARKAGKSFRSVDRKSLEMLQAYAWPGNIRELQNVIERSVIVSESETFSVDRSWLSGKPHAQESKSRMEITRDLAAQEKEAIEAALRECGGRVSGPSGAAARLGIPGSTLESKIKVLKINKNRFRP
jgi:formate hydrogenlyase transcriptional activator